MNKKQKRKNFLERATQEILPLIIEELTNTMVDEELVKGGGLRTEEEMRKSCPRAVKKKLNQELREIQGRFEEGLQIIMDDIPHILTESELQDFEEEMGSVRVHLQKLKEGDEFANQMQSMSFLADFLGLTEKTMRGFYRVGYRQYESKDFHKASKVFFVLTTFNPLVCDYWLAYGLANHQMESYEMALKCYASATFLDPTKPLPRWYSTEAYLATGELDDAFLEWQELEKLVKEDSLDESWQEIAKHLKAKIDSLKQE